MTSGLSSPPNPPSKSSGLRPKTTKSQMGAKSALKVLMNEFLADVAAVVAAAVVAVVAVVAAVQMLSLSSA